MKISALIRIIAMIMVFCLFLTSCDVLTGIIPGLDGILGGPTDDLPDEDPDDKPGEDPDDKPDDPDDQPPVPECKHTETETKNAKATTCTVPGYTGDKVCSTCGTIIEKGTEIPVAEHTYDDGMTTKNPTCIETGTFTYTCTMCGTTKTSELPTVAHDDQYHDALDGTHTHTCTTCTLSENLAHTPTDAGTYYEASCLEAAYIEYTCSICEGVYKVYSELELATGHSWGDWILVEATCVEDGSKVHSCEDCDASESIVLPATPDAHSYVFSGYEGNEPTCAEGAVAIYVCKDCKDASYTKDVPATGLHNYVVVEDSGDGWIISVCSGCDKEISKFDASHLTEAEVKTESIPDDKPFEVTTQNATIEFPTDVIGQIKGDSGESLDVSISAGILDESKKNEAINNAGNLSDEEKARLNDVEIYDFNVTVSGAALSDNFATAVTVTIPYTLKTLVDEDGNEYLEDADGIVIWYVSADGTITEITDVQYNAENETVTFLAPHFSMYAVAYAETQELKCRRGYHAWEEKSTVEASCSTHGYTVYECTCCKRTTIDHIVEKKLHTYGDIIDPNPTCENGDYYHRICSDCGDVLYLQYVRALGHQLDKVAGCETGSFCSRCNRTVTLPLGHNWSEWRVIIPAGELTKGLRVRYCYRCGKADTSTTASIGDVTALEFESYEQIAEMLYDLVIGLDNGIIEVSFVLNGAVNVTAKLTVNQNGDDLLLLADYKLEEDGEVTEGSLLYRNGVCVLDTLSNNPSIGVLDLDAAIFMPVNVALQYMEEYYNLVNPYAELYLSSAREELTKYLLLAGAEIDKALEAAGSEYRSEDLYEILDSVETVYAYVSLKLGYSTAAEIRDGVSIPTKNDLLNVMKAFMEETKEGENTKYSVNAEPLLEAIDVILTWIEENQNESAADLLFLLLGEDLATIDASIKDIDTLVAYLKTNLPGTLTVKDVLDDIISVLEESGEITIDELYEVINAVIAEATGEEIDVEAMISDLYNVTLNDLAVEMFGEGATAEQIYEMLAEEMKKMTLGSIAAGEGMTVADLVAMLSAQLETIVLEAEFSFTVDKDGKIVSITLDEFFNVITPDEDGNNVETAVQSLTLNIIRDDTVKVVVPDRFKPVDNKIEVSYDSEGNLVISGIPSDFEVDIDFDGYFVTDLSNILQKDNELSEKLGYEVYSTHKDFWTDTTNIGSFMKVDGKYYRYTMTHITVSLDKYSESVDVFEFIEDPTIVIPDEGEEPFGYYEGSAVYLTAVGAMMQIDGEWWVCEVDMRFDKNSEELVIGYVWQEYLFNERFGSDNEIRISSINEDDINLYIGENTYWFDAEFKDGSYYFVYNINKNYYDGKTVYCLDEEVDIDGIEYDRADTWKDTLYLSKTGSTDDAQLTEVEYVYLYKSVPSYYAKVAENAYVLLNRYYFGNTTVPKTEYNVSPVISYTSVSLDYDGPLPVIPIPDGSSGNVSVFDNFSNYNVSGLETKALTDGNTMYVLGVSAADRFGYSYGDIYFGYVRVAENKYVRVYCVEQNGSIVEIKYENASSTRRMRYGQVYNAEDYTTVKADGTIVISKDIINKIKDLCVDEGDYASVNIYAEKSIGDESYTIICNPGIEVIPEKPQFGGTDIRGDIFYDLFYGSGSGSDSKNDNIYVDGDGNLVIEGTVHYSDIWFNDRFPADSVLNYNPTISEQEGYDIYTYETVNEYTTEYLVIDGKYYNYWSNTNYKVYTDSLENIIRNNWRISYMDYSHDVYPNETIEESVPVYTADVVFNDSRWVGPSRGDSITLYVMAYEGKLCVLTGAYPTGESLITFEGYTPIADYFNSLEITVCDYYTPAYYVDNVETEFVCTNVTLSEPDYDISKTIELCRASNGEYVYDADYDGSILHYYEEDQVEIPDNYVSVRIYERNWNNGTFTFESFSYEEVNTYKAIRIGDRFYDYDDFRWYSYGEVIGEDEFEQKMYDTDRCYGVYDESIGAYRFYDKFIPGNYFEVYEELVGFTLPESYNETVLGYTKDDQAVVEFWFYIDETQTPEIEETELSDGSVFYHIDGQGYIKLKDGLYVRAIIVEHDDGTLEPVCLLRRAYISDYHLRNYGFFDKYISRTNNKVVIPAEMLEYMSDMPDSCYFNISTTYNYYRFDYYVLESYFMNGGDFGGDNYEK